MSKNPVICAECDYVGKVAHTKRGDYLTCERANNEIIYNSKPDWCPLNTVQVVITIPNYVYEHVKENTEDSRDESEIMYAVANGIPLPKDHGDLIDGTRLLKEWDRLPDRGRTEFDQAIMIAPKII